MEFLNEPSEAESKVCACHGVWNPIPGTVAQDSNGMQKRKRDSSAKPAKKDKVAKKGKKAAKEGKKKRAPTAFIIFSQEQREKILKKDPGEDDPASRGRWNSQLCSSWRRSFGVVQASRSARWGRRRASCGGR
jgi:hypothetical protein